MSDEHISMFLIIFSWTEYAKIILFILRVFWVRDEYEWQETAHANLLPLDNRYNVNNEMQNRFLFSTSDFSMS